MQYFTVQRTLLVRDRSHARALRGRLPLLLLLSATSSRKIALDFGVFTSDRIA